MSTSEPQPDDRSSEAATGPFPPDFLWGAATAAHQVEGGNVNNDWWAFEHNPATAAREKLLSASVAHLQAA